jgi:hypothetical protein
MFLKTTVQQRYDAAISESLRTTGTVPALTPRGHLTAPSRTT